MSQDTQVIEKRVKSTVIRRRKEIVAPPPVEVKKSAELVSKVDKVDTQAEPLEEKKEGAKAAPVVVSPEADGSHGPAQKQVSAESKQADKEKTTPTAPKTTSEKNILPVIPSILTAEEEEEQKKPKYKKVVKKKEEEIEVDLEGVGKVASITQLTRLAHVERIERVFQPSRLGKRKKVITKRGFKKTPLTIAKAAKRVVEMDKVISVSELAHAMGVKAAGVIAKLMAMGMMATINSEIDFDAASLVAHEFQFEVKSITFDETKILDENVLGVHLTARPPVVTVMGHVDHGKTSLLDAIRKTKVTEGEAGGITQHIGAYTVTMTSGPKASSKITFLDTPGHEAFTAMRARGAKATDIVILVVAADDGIMPQTIESIDHAKAAGVPIVVAVNKIDKPEANIDRVKRQLAEQGLSPEEWGGETLYALVSAKKKEGIDDLLEKVLLQAEVLELQADPIAKAKGIVIEARLDRFRGPVATVLIQQGTLKGGEVLVAGGVWGRVRAMTNYRGESVLEAGPSEAVEILGIDGVPLASDIFHAVADEATAREISEHRLESSRDKKQGAVSKVSLEDLFSKIQQGDVKELDIILKTDVQGSYEAVSEALKKLSTEKVRLKIIHGAVGGITESDVLLAAASGAIVFGFNVRPETNAMKVAQREMIQIKLYKIIYEMVNDVKLAMQGLLAPTKKEIYLGRAQVRQTFAVSKIGTVAGCFVVDGKIHRGAEVRLLRDNIVVCEGKISSLKRFKDDAREVLENYECGIGIEGYHDIKPGDVIEAFDVELMKTEL